MQGYGVYGLGICRGKDSVIWMGAHGNLLIGVDERAGTYFKKNLENRGLIVMLPYFDWTTEKIVHRN